MWGGIHEDIILCAILKPRLQVVPGTFIPPILLLASDIDVVPFLLGEHDHAFGTLDALFRLALAPDWGLGFPKSAGGGFDIGNLAVITNHIFVGQTAMVGDPEGGADTTAWRALWQVGGDFEGGQSAVGSAGPQMSVKGQKWGNFVPLVGCKNDEVLHSDLAEVIVVGDGKGPSGCTW